MLPDRMRGWLKRTPAGATQVVLSADLASGLFEIGSWEGKEVEELHGQSDGDVATLIITACQEYADGEESTKRIKFLIQWKGTRKAPMKTTTHWATPTPKSEGEESGIAPGISDATIIRDLLRAHGDKDKVLMDALKATAEAYERIISVQGARLDAFYKEESEAPLAPTVELTEQQQAEGLQRSEAIGLLMDRVPALFDLGMALLEHKALKSAGIKGDVVEDVVDAAGKAVRSHELPPKPAKGLYSLTKSVQEMIAEFYVCEHGMAVAALRVGYILDGEKNLDKYGKQITERNAADTDRRDIGEVARLSLELADLTYETFTVMSTQESMEPWDVQYTCDRLGWKPKYDFSWLKDPSA